MPVPLQIGPLGPSDVDGVRALARAAEAADGVAPVSEQPLLRLSTDEGWLTHVVARSKSGQVIGYAQVDRGGAEASAELVVHPEHRRTGVGSLLLRTAERDATLPQFGGTAGHHGKALRVWAHGNLEPARAFAAAAGYVVVRELLFLTKPLPPVVEPVETTPPVVEPVETTPPVVEPVETTPPVVEPVETTAPVVEPVETTPASTSRVVSTGPTTGGGSTTGGDYRIRTFAPGADDAAWVTLNARAFASHPEQGRLTVADLHDRMAEPWFDPAGFFLVEAPDGTLAGSLWTKVEGEDGEIYAVGVDPAHQGRGLGAALTAVGLDHLATRARRATLYVDGDNAAARATYARAGFVTTAVDVQYGKANDAIIGP